MGLWSDIRELGKETAPNRQRRYRPATVPTPMSYRDRVVSEELDRVRSAAPGERNRTLLTAARNLGKYVAGGSLDEDEASQLLTEAALAAGLGQVETDRAIGNGFRYGEDDPRSFPDETGDDDDEDPASILDELRAALIDTDGLDDIAPPTPLVDGYLFLDSTATIYGHPGAGKSFIALDIAGSVSTGTAWHDHATKRGSVLYVVAEGTSGIRQRVRAWEREHGRKMVGVYWLPIATQAGSAYWDGLIDLSLEIKPRLVVLDTQARVTVGKDENSAKDMGQFVHDVDRLRRATGACVLTVHHAGKSGSYRGNSALLGGFDTYIEVSKEDELITVHIDKQKDAPEAPDFKLRLAAVAGSIVPRRADPTDVPAVNLDSPELQQMLQLWEARMGFDEVTLSELEAAEVVPDRRLFIRSRHALVTERRVAVIGSGSHARYRLIKRQ